MESSCTSGALGLCVIQQMLWVEGAGGESGQAMHQECPWNGQLQKDTVLYGALCCGLAWLCCWHPRVELLGTAV